MKKVIHGSLHQATNLQLNKLTNKNIATEIEENSDLLGFLNQFINHVKATNSVPNAKEMRSFVKTYKTAGNHLPIKPKELKSKTVLYLKYLNSRNGSVQLK